ncbi:hypothetical protein DAMNIGENAA_25360 [Desulforhabdus amnigena]|jgi:hypothetical protein|uniref:Uncharacterized protein n=1 Tax=Desulforhabdus amnigena TaxID=40218 RepID=A0A9W6FUH9_9BACT|nr:hypothetical protein DAMNIGENAA_25360 [Desulforhabdus amnigena]
MGREKKISKKASPLLSFALLRAYVKVLTSSLNRSGKAAIRYAPDAQTFSSKEEPFQKKGPLHREGLKRSNKLFLES